MGAKVQKIIEVRKFFKNYLHNSKKSCTFAAKYVQRGTYALHKNGKGRRAELRGESERRCAGMREIVRGESERRCVEV